MPPSFSQRKPVLTARSPGKINLFLEITGRRDDGYHQLETVMARTNLCDTLEYEDRDDGVIKLTLSGWGGPLGMAARALPAAPLDFPLDATNLIVQAASSLQQYAGCPNGASIRICKRIPGQAGLGGGSANAATTLLSLNQLWNLNLPQKKLHAIAATLGSDVNFLLSGCRAAVCTGRGEHVAALNVRGLRHAVLIVPYSGNATADVFAALELPDSPRSIQLWQQQLQNSTGQQYGNLCFNRLQVAAEQLNPQVSRALTWLKQHAGSGHLTGSGSGCFALVRSAGVARHLVRRFSDRRSATATAIHF